MGAGKAGAPVRRKKGASAGRRALRALKRDPGWMLGPSVVSRITVYAGRGHYEHILAQLDGENLERLYAPRTP